MGTTQAISLQRVERWLAGATTNPSEARKKVKLKMLLMRGAQAARTSWVHTSVAPAALSLRCRNWIRWRRCRNSERVEAPRGARPHAVESRGSGITLVGSARRSGQSLHTASHSRWRVREKSREAYED